MTLKFRGSSEVASEKCRQIAYLIMTLFEEVGVVDVELVLTTAFTLSPKIKLCSSRFTFILYLSSCAHEVYLRNSEYIYLSWL